MILLSLDDHSSIAFAHCCSGYDVSTEFTPILTVTVHTAEPSPSFQAYTHARLWYWPGCPCWCSGPSTLPSSQCCSSASCASQTALPSWAGCCCSLKGWKSQNMLAGKYFHIQIFFPRIKAHLNYFKAQVKKKCMSHFQWNVLSEVDGSESEFLGGVTGTSDVHSKTP